MDGYFRVGEEDEFPWQSREKSVWYALFVIENGEIKTYGATPAISQKRELITKLKEVNPKEALLIGVWTGQHSTHLFKLDIPTAIEKLESAVGGS